jgi:phosphate starvation-inducible PhoH-like protein
MQKSYKKTAKKQISLIETPKVTTPLLEKQDFKHIKFSHNQLKFFNLIRDNIITTCTGPAGTAKTFIACYSALDHYSKGNCKKIVLVKPAVESGDALGFLPGTLQEKIAPFMESYVSNMEKIIGKEKLELLILSGVIEMKSLSHIRGATEDDSFMIIDETQNSDLRQILLFVTRMGKNSKIVCCGDTTQYDMMKRKKEFSIFIRIMAGIKGLESFEFMREDIVRHPMLIEITDRYEKYKSENNIE